MLVRSIGKPTIGKNKPLVEEISNNLKNKVTLKTENLSNRLRKLKIITDAYYKSCWIQIN